MNRVDRLLAIALCLQSHRVVRAADLAARFEISLRTVYRDLAALGEAGVPIAAEAGVGYSLVKGYHLPPVMFTAEEASALLFGEKLVEQFTDASLRKAMAEALLKIRSVLPRDRQDFLERLERATAVPARGGYEPPRLRSKALIPIQGAIAERRVLALQYRSGKQDEVTRREVEPLGLIYYAENWHLIAWCRLRREVRDFRTDRILQLEVSGERFTGHDDFSLTRFLEQGGTDTHGLLLTRVRFSPDVMERVRREHAWGLVEETPTPDGVVVTLTDPAPTWLARWVLSFGVSAEVLEPQSFRAQVAREARALVEVYAESPAVC